MLIRITNRCSMGCSHCCIDASGPDGSHMSRETFTQALRFREQLGSHVVLLSGGEPTDHPEFLEMAREALATIEKFGALFVIVSNGLFALDEFRYEQMVRLVEDHNGRCVVQITNVPKYYPRDLFMLRHKFQRPHWAYTGKLQQIVPCRRVEENGLEPTRVAPLCFNLRANVRLHGLSVAVVGLERAARSCCPSVNVDGSVRAGEMDTCFKLGTVSDSVEDIEANVRSMSCNTCGLRDNLKLKDRAMIGEK